MPRSGTQSEPRMIVPLMALLLFPLSFSDSPLMFQGGGAHRCCGTAVICIALMSLIPHRRRRTRRQWARVHLDHAMRNAHAVGDELLGERRRRAAVLQPVLVAVPRAGHAAVD